MKNDDVERLIQAAAVHAADSVLDLVTLQRIRAELAEATVARVEALAERQASIDAYFVLLADLCDALHPEKGAR